MTRRFHRLLAGLALLATLAGCGEPPPYKQQSYVFGTLVDVTVYGESEDLARQATDQVLKDFDQLHKSLHAWEPSDLERMNALLAQATPGNPARGELPAWLAPLLQDAARLSALSEGLFNPAIGNLVRLWGFHSDTFEARLPDPGAVARLVQAQPRMSDITFNDNGFEGHNPAVRLDLGGYAKGHALDQAAATLRRLGVENALVNIGGNIIALGRHGERPWKVGIQHPRRAGAIATLELHDGEAIGTSGDYQRYFELAGKRYCHLIDPRTGWPAQGTQAVTVLVSGPHAGTLSDVASKPLFIAGARDWRRLAGVMGVARALRVDADGQVSVTAALAPRLQWTEPPPAVSVVP